MIRKVTVSAKATYYIDDCFSEEAITENCLDWFSEVEPSIEISPPIAECELGMRCPYNHNCSECK